MEQPTPTISAPAEQADAPLIDEITATLLRLRPVVGVDPEVIDQACRDQADAVMDLLEARGHVLPGAPPAQRIFQDAKRFHDQFVLAGLAVRILNMLTESAVQTPETKPALEFIRDYLEGKNHGPVGQAMLWPGRLPGLASMLREWGFVPTIATPGSPSWVARAAPNPTVQ